MTEVLAPPRLPRILVVSDGRTAGQSGQAGPPDGHPLMPPSLDAGLLVRDTDLASLVALDPLRDVPVALDLDTIRGLGADEAAVAFVCDTLRVRIVATRRPHVAAWAAERGAIALLQVLAYDSTGVARSLAGHPGGAVGTVVSPGLVLARMRPDELAALPRPIVAWGLIGDVDDALEALGLADAIVLAGQTAWNLATALATRAQVDAMP